MPTRAKAKLVPNYFGRLRAPRGYKWSWLHSGEVMHIWSTEEKKTLCGLSYTWQKVGSCTVGKDAMCKRCLASCTIKDKSALPLGQTIERERHIK